jgi:AcrR family transcriptional regulator
MARRAEVFEERRQQIMEGALTVFSTKGFAHATNKDVAKAAGIASAGLIYHYFEDKADLLRAVIEQYLPPMQLVLHRDELMALPPDIALARFGHMYLHLLDDPKVGACLRLLLSEALRDPAFAQTFAEAGMLRVWRLLAAYFAFQMEQGRLRRIDPDTAVRRFVGPLVVHFFLNGVLRLPNSPSTTPPETLVADTVEAFLRDMRPERSTGD